MAYMRKAPAGRPNFMPFWQEDANPAQNGNKKLSGYGNQATVLLWNPQQPECGPVYHVMVNFKRLLEKEQCTGKNCKHCKATKIYTDFLREKYGEERV